MATESFKVTDINNIIISEDEDSVKGKCLSYITFISYAISIGDTNIFNKTEKSAQRILRENEREREREKVLSN